MHFPGTRYQINRGMIEYLDNACKNAIVVACREVKMRGLNTN